MKIITYSFTPLLTGILFTLIFAQQSIECSKDMHFFIKPVQFSSCGIKDFFLERFNDHFYTENVLPLCFLHMEDFVYYGLTSRHSKSIAMMTLDLFHQKLKECRWVNPFALTLLLKNLPSMLGSLCVDETDLQKARVKSLIFDAMEKRFDQFKDNPENFISSLSDTIVEELFNPATPTAQEISGITVRFIESALDKLIWDPRDQEYTWESVKLIAKHLEILFDTNVIVYEKDLNHMYWSLISRFCYFIDLSRTDLSLICYQQIKNDISDAITKAPFLLKEELEEHSITKKDRLMQVVLAGEMSSKINSMPQQSRQK